VRPGTVLRLDLPETVVADAQDRDALLASGGPQLSRKYAHLFAETPSFDKVDVLQARL
jgi:hypothetical protein